MQILLAFAPFLVFAVADRLFGSGPALAAAAVVALLLLLRDILASKRTVKIFDVGTTILFCGLSLYSFIARPVWSVIVVRLYVDCGLLLIVLASILLGKPFTLQYAREQVAPEFWDSPVFRKTNFVISWVWAAAFAIMVLTELALLSMPNAPKRGGILIIVLALVGAIKFTGWYPQHVRSRSPRATEQANS
jgi:hypothetical protein